jgi:drug/metabolite transporter (DMT)-like permease
MVFIEHLILFALFFPRLYKSRFKFWNEQVSTLFYFVIVGGLGSAIATVSFTKAFSLVNPSLVILFQKLQPIVAITLARIFLAEKIKRGFIPWAVVALCGSFLISYEDIFSTLMNFDFSGPILSKGALVGYFLTLLAVFSWASATVFGKKLTAKGFSTQEIMGGRFFFGLLVIIPMVSFQKQVLWGEFELLDTLAKILLMVVLSGLLGMYFYYKGLKSTTARVAALLELFFPLFAIVLNWVFLGHFLEPVQMLGAFMLLLSSVVIQWKQF